MRELRPLLLIASPVVIAELGWVTMGIVDTLMVGRLGADAIAAVGLSSVLFFAVSIFSMGLLLGLDPLVSHAFGAGRIEECHRWLVQGLWLALMTAPPFVGVVFLIRALLLVWGMPGEVVALARPYLAVLVWSLPPLLVFVACRRYLQAMNIVRPLTIILIAANIVNAVANWILVFGRFGVSPMGVRGSAFATLTARVFMAASLLGIIAAHESRVMPRLRDTPRRIDPGRLRRLFVLGFPAAMQAVFEVGVFAIATALAGRVSASALAANQIALNLASFTFMVPFGLASAAAVRVGQAMGGRRPHDAVSAGWTAIALGVGFMAFSALVFISCRGPLVRAFTPDPSVVRIGVSLLAVAAFFQLFDGMQAVTTGALRGIADTRTPMLWNLLGHWCVGLPLGYTLCFRTGLGVTGLWWGLSAGLMICGVALLLVWMKRASALLMTVQEGSPWQT